MGWVRFAPGARGWGALAPFGTVWRAVGGFVLRMAEITQRARSQGGTEEMEGLGADVSWQDGRGENDLSVAFRCISLHPRRLNRRESHPALR